MTENLREIVLGVIAAGVTAALGWFARTYLWRRKLRRKQRFFGLPQNSECLLVVSRDPATEERAVARHDVFALLELSALIKDCGARMDVLSHDASQQGFGERTEFCVGGPEANSRTAAHLSSLLPGVEFSAGNRPGPDKVALRIGGERYRMDKGREEYVLLARLTAGQGNAVRPVFVLCGQTGVANQAAARHLARHHARLARKYGMGSGFCLLLKVVNSQAYGPDVTELVSDVTRAATTPAPPSSASSSGDGPARRGNHRANT